MFGEVGQLDVDASSQTRTQVGWASEDVTKMLVPAEGMAGTLEDLLNLYRKMERDSRGGLEGSKESRP